MHQAIKNASRRDLSFAQAFIKADINHLSTFSAIGHHSAEQIAVLLDREHDLRAIQLRLEGKPNFNNRLF